MRSASSPTQLARTATLKGTEMIDNEMLERLLAKSEVILLRLVGQPETIALIEAKCELREVIQECKEARKERETATPHSGTQSFAAAFSQPESVAEPVARF